jgi:asparagine synthase (glutamine-hydrolysing)
MCGIFGISLRDDRALPSEALMATTLRAMAHRGPDSSDVFIEPGIGLAHTRLSLLDLSERGRQPFWDPTGRYCIVYNGEVYNFRELRKELENDGVAFLTTTDTEVVLHGLIRWGPEAALRRLKGMFAFGLYDRERRDLLLARDRFGIKPLVIYEGSVGVIFSSEVKALKPWVPFEANANAISAYLLGFGGPTKGQSFFKGIRIVPPGALVRLQLGGSCEFESFATIADGVDPGEETELRSLDASKVVDRLDELLHDSVKKMLFADAPVGAFCSGGVDSSIIMAIAARYHSNLTIFHADLVGPWSEFEAAHALADHLGLELQRTEVRDQHFVDLIPVVTWHNGHPYYYHPNSVAFYAVSNLVRENHVKAVLSGEGADECFLGYPYIAREPVVKFCERQAARLMGIARNIPIIGNRLRRLNQEAPDSIVGLLSGFERDLERDAVEKQYLMRRGRDLDWNVRTLIWLGYHLRSLLHRNDALGMAASIEARFPFLDERIVRYAINLPHHYKIRFSPSTWEKAHPFFQDKWVLRALADRYLPRRLSRRKKLGFHVTAYERMNIGASCAGEHGFVAEHFDLDRRQLHWLFEQASQQERVELLLLEVWGRVCLRDEGLDETREHLRRTISFATPV